MKKFFPGCQKSLITMLTLMLLWCTAEAQFNYHRAYNLGADAHTPALSLTASTEYINVGFYFPNQINGQPVSTARMPILHLDASFNVNWSKLYVTSSEIQNDLFDVEMRGFDVKETSDGNFVVCGEITETDIGGVPLKYSFIMLTDNTGNVTWFNKYFLDGNLNSIVETDDNGFMACGYIETTDGGEENRLLRVDASGNVVWLRTFFASQGNGPHSAFREIIRNGSDSYIVVGDCARLVDDCGPTEADVLLVLVSESGSTTFTNYQVGRGTSPNGDQFAEFGNSVTVNGQGNIIVAGHVVKSNVNNCDPASNLQDLLLFKIHPMGTVLFSHEVDLINDDIGRDVTINSLFSEICVAGIADNNKNGFLYTTDMNGGFQKLEFFNHAGFDTQAKAVVENGSGLYTWIGNSEVIGTGYNDIYLVEQDPSTTQDCHDWDESRDPIIIDLEVLNPDDITLDLGKITVDVEALDLEVVDSVLCAEPCDPPVAVDDFGEICKDATTHLVVNVLANDTYSPPVTIPTVFVPDYGVVTFGINPGELRYLPDFGYVGPDTIEYVIQDACGTDTALFVIEVVDVPEAVDDFTTVCEGSSTGSQLDVTLNDNYTGTASILYVIPSNGALNTFPPPTPPIYYPDAGFVGNDTIEYYLTDDCGTDTALWVIEVIEGPDANFSSSSVGTTVSFTDLSTNNPTSWLWDFGDGATSILQNPTHNYASLGTYTVCLTVANDCGEDIHCEDVNTCDPVDPVNDFLAACGGTGGSMNVLGNDFFTPPVTVSIVSAPTNGTASLTLV
ncbi:MAG: PKD domain-containing protein, partial [Bacteroidota bacterium]